MIDEKCSFVVENTQFHRKRKVYSFRNVQSVLNDVKSNFGVRTPADVLSLIRGPYSYCEIGDGAR